MIPAGLFSPARTYSLVRDDAGLYVIYTGRAMGPRTGSGVAGAVGRQTRPPNSGAKLRESGASAMKATKHSHFISKTSIKRVEADKKLKFHCSGHEPSQLAEFFAPLAKG